MVERLTFLGLDEAHSNPDVVIIPIPYELTTSYGQGTSNGPMAAIEASAQVEVFDPRLSQDLPAGARFQTLDPWSSEAGTLTEQLTEIESHLRPWLTNTDVFPLILGGEHGLLPVQMKAIMSGCGLQLPAEHPVPLTGKTAKSRKRYTTPRPQMTQILWIPGKLI